MKLVVSIMAIVGLVIIGEAIYAFTRPEKLNLTQGAVLIGIAIVALVVLMATLWVIWKGLSKKP